MPPPAEGFAARFVVGPALRTQPDRRLVALVREGYEHAFEEIVRRYGRPLTRYAGAIVGNRADDVTQDAFSKALLALRRSEKEIELRPWLFRIVRNTALNDLRDRPPTAEALAEALAGGSGPEEELARREELTDLMRRLASLPEAQRAAIVMRELEGLSHEEIAKALGLSGGAARQTIFRARQALRDGLGMLLPLPLLKGLLAGTAGAPVEAAAGAAGIGGGAAGAGVVLKAATATVLVAGAVGAGVAIDHGRQAPHRGGDAATSEARRIADDQVSASSVPAGDAGAGAGSGWDDSSDHGEGGNGESESSDVHGHHGGRSEGHSGSSGPGPSGDGGSSGSGRGPDGGSGGSGHHFGASDDHSGGGDGSSGPGGGDGERRSGGSGNSGPGSSGSSGGSGGSSGSGSGGSGDSGGSGSGEPSNDSGPGGGPPPPPEGSVTETNSGPGSGSGSSGSSGSGSGSGSGSSPDGSGASSDSRGGSGFSVQTGPQS